MGKYEVILTPNAFKSLQVIHGFIESSSKTGAKKIIKGLIAHALTLESFPRKHPEEPKLVGLEVVYRFLVKWNYKIVFTILEKEKIVLVVWAIDTRQNPDRIWDFLKD